MKTSHLHKSLFEIYVKISFPAKVGGNSEQWAGGHSKIYLWPGDQWWPFPDLSRAQEGRRGDCCHTGHMSPSVASPTLLPPPGQNMKYQNNSSSGTIVSIVDCECSQSYDHCSPPSSPRLAHTEKCPDSKHPSRYWPIEDINNDQYLNILIPAWPVPRCRSWPGVLTASNSCKNWRHPRLLSSTQFCRIQM